MGAPTTLPRSATRTRLPSRVRTHAASPVAVTAMPSSARTFTIAWLNGSILMSPPSLRSTQIA
jgi:hypothetical protein